MKLVSVLCHLYYKDSLAILEPYLKNFDDQTTRFFFNICSDLDYKEELIKNIYSAFENAIITSSPNVGKDIGGKLILIDTYLKLQERSTYLVFLHDKISPHTSTGDAWREKLLSIIEEKNIKSIVNTFNKHKKIGLIANKNLINNEYDVAKKGYTCTSEEELLICRKKYFINTTNHDFIAGTMFWIRSEIYESFFNLYKPLQIRKTLESGNVLDHKKGTFTHAWERMLSWIILNEGYTLKGI